MNQRQLPMRNPITNQLTTVDLSKTWITVQEAAPFLGLSSNEGQKELIQLLEEKKLIPYFDFVYKYHKFRHIFSWVIVREGALAEQIRKQSGDPILISLKCLAELREKYLEDIEKYHEEEYLYLKSIGQEK